MRTLALVLLLVTPLTGCPEQRSPASPRPRPPQATLAAGAGALPDILTVRRPDGYEWYGLYLVGKKAGWTRSSVRREIRDGRDVLVGRSEMLIRATVGDREVDRREEEEHVWDARPGGRLLSFRATLSGDGGDRTETGSCDRSTCRVVIVGGGSREERSLENRETAEMADAPRLAAGRRGAVSGPMLDTAKLKYREMRFDFVRRETIAGAGVAEEVSVVSGIEQGDRIAQEYRVADDGRIVEIKIGEGVIARPETEETARRFDKVDLFALARVALPRALPRDVPRTIVYRLSGLPRAFLKSDPRQRFQAGPDGTTIVTVTARRPAAADPAKDTPLARARSGADPEDLDATAEVNWDAPGIVELARQVAGDAKGTYEAARRLSEHVYERLDKAYGASHDRASDVLAAGKGDCTEHTVLLVALARALGIPARPVHGLVFAQYGDGQPALYWHAWPEIRSAGEWIPLDPTFGEPVADATHVLLGTGQQVDSLGLLGSLKVVAVEVRDGK